MPIYVLNKDGQPLMPTSRAGKVRRMLRDGKAKVVRHCPFTIRLLYDTGNIVQDVSLGIDAGSKQIGISATTETVELYAGEVRLRDDISKNLTARREFRRGRRNRKTRYRKARFDNRVRSKHKGWLAPSVEAKIETHIRVISDICSVLPVSRITIEVAAFDTQKMQNPEISGIEYQQGALTGYTIREYLAEKFKHKCCYCGTPQGNGIRFEVEHLTPKARGGSNQIVNLGWSCHDCNEKKGELTCEEFGHPEVRKTAEVSMKHATHMSIMRWKLYERLKAIYGDRLYLTYGAMTSYRRNAVGLEKTHAVDARCISGNPKAKPSEYIYYQKKVRCHNRRIHKSTISKGGIRKRNQTVYEVKGFRLFDKVEYNGQECFIFGRRGSGYFDIRKLDGAKVHAGISYKKLRLVETRHTMLTERRMAG